MSGIDDDRAGYGTGFGYGGLAQAEDVWAGEESGLGYGGESM